MSTCKGQSKFSDLSFTLVNGQRISTPFQSILSEFIQICLTCPSICRIYRVRLCAIYFKIISFIFVAKTRPFIERVSNYHDALTQKRHSLGAGVGQEGYSAPTFSFNPKGAPFYVGSCLFCLINPLPFSHDFCTF